MERRATETEFFRKGCQWSGGGESRDAQNQVIFCVDRIFQGNILPSTVNCLIREVEVTAACFMIGKHLTA